MHKNREFDMRPQQDTWEGQDRRLGREFNINQSQIGSKENG